MPRPHLKYVIKEKTRHGKTVWYYRRKGEPRHRLPPPSSPLFADEYRRALSKQPPSPSRLRRHARAQMIERSLRVCINGARARAAAKGLAFDLDMDWARDELVRNDFRCPLTGIEFHADCKVDSYRSPFVPSLDRIAPGKGYTKDNVRIVIIAINVMMSDWGEDVFSKVASAFKKQRFSRGL